MTGCHPAPKATAKRTNAQPLRHSLLAMSTELGSGSWALPPSLPAKTKEPRQLRGSRWLSLSKRSHRGRPVELKQNQTENQPPPPPKPGNESINRGFKFLLVKAGWSLATAGVVQLLEDVSEFPLTFQEFQILAVASSFTDVRAPTNVVVLTPLSRGQDVLWLQLEDHCHQEC